MNSGSTTGTASYGIFFTGASDTNESATGSVIGNTIDGYGIQGTATSAAIYTYQSDGVVIGKNTILRASPIGIYAVNNNSGMVIGENSIFDVWSTAVTNPIGIYINSTGSSISVSGNNIADGTKTADHTLADGTGIKVADSDGVYVQIGRNFYFGVETPILDSGEKAMYSDMKIQNTVTAKTTAATLTVAELKTGLITGLHAAGATQAYTLPLGTTMDAVITGATAGIMAGKYEAFDWTLINTSVNAVDTITVTANTGHTLVGSGIVQSSHSTTGGLYGNAATFRTRRTATNTWITYRLN
jgi:hypothetical protein